MEALHCSRDPSFVKSIMLEELSAAREADESSARRALAYARIARAEFGLAAVGSTEQEADRAAAAINALNEVVALARAQDLQVFLSAISRPELILSGY